MVEEGDAAPDFELESDAGEKVKLSALRGSQVVVYFYPKDDTPGCTTQACGIRDVYGEFGAWGEKKNYGKTYMGIIRSTFVIDAEGKLKKAMRNVKPDTHADKVLQVLAA